MNFNFNGFNENVLTIEADSKLDKAGVFVKFTAEGKVTPCTQGDKICGYAVNVRDGYAAVQLKGYVCADSDGGVDCGWQFVSVTTDGKLTIDADGMQVLVISAGSDTAGIIL